MSEYQKGAHTVYDIKYHVVWITKYRYKVLEGEIATRTRDLIRKICQYRNLAILQGHVGKDHVHLLISAPPDMSVSKIVQYLKGTSSRQLQQEFPQLQKRYWGRHLWAQGYFCATTGNITDELIKKYIENQNLEAPPDNFTVIEEDISKL